MATVGNVDPGVEGELVWPASNAEDPSRSFLNSEWAKYSPIQRYSSMFLSWKGLLEKAHWVFDFFFRPCVSNAQFGETPYLQDDDAEAIVATEGQGQAVDLESNGMSSASEDDVIEHPNAPDDGISAVNTSVKTYVSTAEVNIVQGVALKAVNDLEQQQERYDTEVADGEKEHFDGCKGEPDVIEEKFEIEAEESTQLVISESENLCTDGLVEKADSSEREREGEGKDVAIANISVQQEYEPSDEKLITEIEVKEEFNEEFTLASEDWNQISNSNQQPQEVEEVMEYSRVENDFESVKKDLRLVEDEQTEMKAQETTLDGLPADQVAMQKSTDSLSSSSSHTEDTGSIEIVEKKEESTSNIVIVTDYDVDKKTFDESIESDKIDYPEDISITDGQNQEEVSEVSESQIEAKIDEIEIDLELEQLKIAVAEEKVDNMEASIASEEKQIESGTAELCLPTIAVTDLTASDESSDKANESFSTTDEKNSKEEVESLSSSSIRSKKEDKQIKVDKATKRIFKRKVKSYIKQIIKSRDLPSFSKNHEEVAAITPTVCRVGTDETTSLSLKKTELSGSRSSLLGRFSSKEDEFVRLAALVGFEGYGKTMLMKRYADMSSGRLINVNELVETGVKRWHPFARKDFFKFVHYIDLRDLPTEGQYTPSELLFQILIKDLPPNEAEVGYRWLQIYKKSMLFIIDSVNDLDMFPEEVRQHIGYSDKASPQTIMYNLLTGNILAKAHVLISSSVTNTSHIADVLSPDRVYVLSGFDRNDIKAYLAKNAKVLKLLTDGSFDNLYSSSKVPLGMFYSTNALIDDEYRLDSLLGAISHYVRNAIKEKKSEKADFNEILDKLKRLSFQCSLQNDEVVHDRMPSISITTEDLARCRLFVEKSVGRIGPDEAIDWIKTFTFGHVTLREYLSALHLCETDMESFTTFANENFGLARFDFQQKSLYGMLLNHANLEFSKDLVTVSHIEEKRNLLRQLLLDRVKGKSPSFYLYTIIHESSDGIDDIVKENLRTLSIVGEKLTSVSMFILSCVASRVGSLDELELRKCFPNDDILRRFLSSAKHDETTVKILNLRENPGILTCGSSIREICQNCKVEELDFSACNFHGDVLAALPRILKDVALKVFRISDNTEISENSVHGIGEFIKKANVKGLGIGNTDLNEAKLQRFGRSIKKFQFDSLDLQKNREIGSQKPLSIVGDIASECKLQNLNIAFCGVTSKHCQILKESLKEHKLKKLDISALEPDDVSLDDLENLSQLLSCIEEELRIVNWQFSSEALGLFKEKVGSSGIENVKIFYGSNGESLSNVKIPPEYAQNLED